MIGIYRSLASADSKKLRMVSAAVRMRHPEKQRSLTYCNGFRAMRRLVLIMAIGNKCSGKGGSESKRV